MTDHVVYETHRRKRAKRSNGTLLVSGVRWLNCDIPRDKHGEPIAHPLDGKCEQCGYGYSHLMRGATQPCNECNTEDVWERVAWWEEQGIPMGLNAVTAASDNGLSVQTEHDRKKGRPR